MNNELQIDTSNRQLQVALKKTKSFKTKIIGHTIYVLVRPAVLDFEDLVRGV